LNSVTNRSLPYTLIDSNHSHKMATSQLFEFQLSSLTQLDVIDKLRDLGVGDLVPLPQASAISTFCCQNPTHSVTQQLVVVGDQSR